MNIIKWHHIIWRGDDFRSFYGISSFLKSPSDSHNLSLHRGLLSPCVRSLEGKPQLSAECGDLVPCRYSPGGPLLNHYQLQTPQWWIPLPPTHSSSRVLGGQGAGHLPEEALGVPGREPVDPSLLQSVWRGTVGVEVDDEGVDDDGSGVGGREGTPAQRHRCRSGVSGCCAHGGCLPQEEPHQTRSSSGPGCLS